MLKISGYNWKTSSTKKKEEKFEDKKKNSKIRLKFQ